MNIFKEMALSVYSFKSYKEFLKNKKGKVFLFGLVLFTIYFFITIGVPMIKFQAATGGVSVLLNEYIPDFELYQGELSLDQELELDYGDVYLYANTSPLFWIEDIEALKAEFRGYSVVLIADSEGLIAKSEGEWYETYYTTDFNFSKLDLMAYSSYLSAIIIAILIFLYIFTGIRFFGGVLIVDLIASIAASIMKIKVTFGKTYKLGVYARTLPLLLKALISLFGISLSLSWIVNIGLSVLYVILALREINKDDESGETVISGGSQGVNEIPLNDNMYINEDLSNGNNQVSEVSGSQGDNKIQ